MTSQTITYKCGHIREIAVPDDAKTAKEVAWKASLGKCPGCNGAGAARNAYFLAAFGDLPALTGTPKQLQWAEKIRAQALADAEAQMPTWSTKPERNPAIRAHLAAQTDAAWWIERRDLTAGDLIKIARVATKPAV